MISSLILRYQVHGIASRRLLDLDSFPLFDSNIRFASSMWHLILFLIRIHILLWSSCCFILLVSNLASSCNSLQNSACSVWVSIPVYGVFNQPIKLWNIGVCSAQQPPDGHRMVLPCLVIATFPCWARSNRIWFCTWSPTTWLLSAIMSMLS